MTIPPGGGELVPERKRIGIRNICLWEGEEMVSLPHSAPETLSLGREVEHEQPSFTVGVYCFILCIDVWNMLLTKNSAKFLAF